MFSMKYILTITIGINFTSCRNVEAVELNSVQHRRDVEKLLVESIPVCIHGRGLRLHVKLQ